MTRCYRYVGLVRFSVKFVDYAATLSFSSVKWKLIKVLKALWSLTIERLASEGRSNRKNIDGLLKRLEDIKMVLDERIVTLSGKSIRRVCTLSTNLIFRGQHS
jgi:hypothetical protein